MEMQNNETIRETIRGFDGVWQRVTTQTATPAPETASGGGDRALRRFIQSEQRAAHDDACLARRLCGRARMLLMQLSSKANCRARSLRAEYFIRTGETCVPHEDDDTPADGCLCALRETYERYKRLSQSYKRAAERTDDEQLRCLYTAAAEETCRAAAALRCVITNCF